MWKVQTVTHLLRKELVLILIVVALFIVPLLMLLKMPGPKDNSAFDLSELLGENASEDILSENPSTRGLALLALKRQSFSLSEEEESALAEYAYRWLWIDREPRARIYVLLVQATSAESKLERKLIDKLQDALRSTIENEEQHNYFLNICRQSLGGLDERYLGVFTQDKSSTSSRWIVDEPKLKRILADRSASGDLDGG